MAALDVLMARGIRRVRTERVIVYLWTAIASETAEHSGSLGISDDDVAARVAAEQYLRDGRTGLAFVETASRVTEAHSLSPCYLPTGAGWWARSGPAGDVQWFRYDGPEAAARLRATCNGRGRASRGPAHIILSCEDPSHV